ncbi:crustacyanin-C1 subunit-like [Cherax quadricarinatus]|uniref:crustacyanin-C1 subunit-like n=1 Tax=Cherax quadricarinatus TaxID=27406 RepID=UPI00387E78FD
MNPLPYLLVLVATVAADKIPSYVVPGKCPVVDQTKLWAQQVPNHAKYAGVWYQIALTETLFQPLSQCVLNEYSFGEKQFNVISSGVSAEGSLLKIHGKVYPSPVGEPELSVDFQQSFPAPYVILKTDYTNYACVYSCIGLNSDYYTDVAFILARSPTPEDRFVKQCEDTFKSINFDTSRLTKTVQGSACDYDNQKAL